MKMRRFFILTASLFLLAPSLGTAAFAHERFSDAAWQKIAPIYQKILSHPFNKELESGKLDRKKFDYYQAQDHLYLKDYSRSLATLATKLSNPRDMDMVLKFAEDSLSEGKTEAIMREQKNTSASPTTLLYTSYELSVAAYKSPEELAAVLLPCFWIYSSLGEELSKHSFPQNPYSGWLNTYKDKDFQKANRDMINLVDRLAENATPETRKRMMDAFVMASRMELLFWDAAYRLEGWK